MGFDYAKAKKHGYTDEEISQELKRRGVSMDVLKASKVGYSSDEIAAEINRRFESLSDTAPKPKSKYVDETPFGIDINADGIIPSVARAAITLGGRATAMANTAAELVGADPIFNKKTIDANLDFTEQTKKKISEKSLSTGRKNEINALDKAVAESDGFGAVIPMAKKMADVALTPSEWTLQGVVETAGDPLNYVGGGAGNILAKGGTTVAGRAARGAVGGAAENAAVNAIAEGAVAHGRGDDSDEVTKAMTMGAIGGTIAGAPIGAISGAAYTPKTNPIDAPTTPDTIAADQQIAQNLSQHIQETMKPKDPLDVIAKGYEDLNTEMYGTDGMPMPKPKGITEAAFDPQTDIGFIRTTSDQPAVATVPDAVAIQKLIEDGGYDPVEAQAMVSGKQIIAREDYDALKTNLLKHDDEDNVISALDERYVIDDRNTPPPTPELTPVEIAKAEQAERVRLANEEAMARKAALEAEQQQPTASAVQEQINPTEQPIIEKPIIGQPEPEAVVKEGLTPVETDTNVGHKVDGTDVKENLTTPQNDYDTLVSQIESHPRFNELIESRRNITAKESVSPNVRVQDRQIIHKNNGGGYETTVIPAQMEKNYAHDFATTKADIAQYEKNGMTPELAEKFAKDLDVYDNNPLYAKAGEADNAGQVVGDKFIDEAGNEMDIPFSRTDGIQYGKGFTSSHIKEVDVGYKDIQGNPLKQYRFLNPVALKDGSRISGFNDRDFNVLIGYDKNGEIFTIDANRFNAEDIDFNAKANNTQAQDVAKRLYDHTTRAFSKGENTINAHSIESITPSIESALGKTVSKKLSQIMSIITKSEIPEAVLKEAGENIDGVHGFVYEGKAYIVADNIPKGWSDAQVRGLVMHEVGVHLRKVGANNKDFARIIDAMKKSKNSEVKQAYERVPDTTKPHLVDEEALAYLIQNNPKNGFVQSIIAWVKSQLIKAGISPSLLKLTPSDLSAMAWGAVKRGDGGVKISDTLYAALKIGKNKEATVNDVKETLLMHRGIYENVEYTQEKWNELFPNNTADTPLGKIKLGDNQFVKLDPEKPNPNNPMQKKQDRRHHLSYIHQTLTNPAIAIEKKSGETLFIKEFDTDKGVKQYASILISHGDMKVVISNHAMDYKQILKEAKAGKTVYMPSEVTANEAALSISRPTSDTAVTESVQQAHGGSQDIKFSKLQEPKVSLQEDRVAAIKAIGAWGKATKLEMGGRNNHFTMNKTYEKAVQDKHSLVSSALDHATILHKAMAEMSPKANAMLQRYIVKDIDQIAEPEYKFLEQLGDDINTYIGKMSDELHELGMIDKETLDMYKGKYLHRLYEEHWFGSKAGDAESKKLPAMYQRGKQLETDDASEVYAYLRDFGEQRQLEPLDSISSNLEEVIADASQKGYFGVKTDGLVHMELMDGKLKLDRDWTKAEREVMGEIESAAVTVPNTIARLANEVQTARMFKKLSEDPDVVYKGSETDEKAIKDLGFVRIDVSKRYGALSGKYVDARVASDLKHLTDMGEAMRGWLKALSLWKQSKTVWNVSAHFNNFTSNIMLRFMAGDNNPFGNMKKAFVSMNAFDEIESILAKKASGKATPEDITALLKLQKENPYLMEARQIGLFGKSQLNDILHGYSGSDVFNKRKSTLGKINDFTQKMYSGEDAIVRYAMYMTRRQKGDSPRKAQRDIEAILPDYTRPLPRNIRVLRDIGVAPFISWSYYVLPNIVRLAAKNKWRAAAVLGAPLLMSEAVMQMQDQSNMDLPTDAVGRRLGVNIDPDGNINTVKVDRIIPGFDIASIPLSVVMSGWRGYQESDGSVGHAVWDATKGGFVATNNFATSIGSGPLTQAVVAAVTGDDAYTGRPIEGGSGSSDGQEAANIGRFIVDKFVPVPLQVMGTYDLYKALSQDQEERKQFQDIVPITTTQQVLKLVPGVNTMTYDPRATAKQLEKDQKRYEKLSD